MAMKLYFSYPDLLLYNKKATTPKRIATGRALIPTVEAPPVNAFEGMGVGVKVLFFGIVTVEVSVAVFVDV